MTWLSQPRHSFRGHVILGCGQLSCVSKDGQHHPWLLSTGCQECPSTLPCDNQKLSPHIVRCPQRVRTSVFILQTRKPRPRETEFAAGCSIRGWNSPQVCPAGEPAFPPSPGRAGHVGSCHWEDPEPLPRPCWCPSNSGEEPGL